MRKPQEQLYADNYLPLQPFLITLSISLALLYWGLQRTFGLPTLLDILISMASTLLGDGTRERIQVLFLGLGLSGSGQSSLSSSSSNGRVGDSSGGGGAGVVARVRAKASEFLGVGGGKLFGVGVGSEDRPAREETVVGGLWNMGNTCYQNSVLQAMASLRYLEPHLALLSTPEALADEELHPSKSLVELFGALNMPRKAHSSAAAYVPNIIRRVDASSSGWMYNEQQDAQEFFQRLTAAVEKEVARYWARKRPVAGLESVGLLFGDCGGGEGGDGEGEGGEKRRVAMKRQQVQAEKKLIKAKLIPEELKNPFEGLSAQRVGCLRCGYVEEIRLQSFTSLSLSLPSTYECSLEECLREYTEIEHIEQVECDKCTLLAQKRSIESLPALAPPSPSSPTSPPLPSSPPPSPDLALLKAQLLHRLALITSALDTDDFSPATFARLHLSTRKVTATKTKQTMIARPPPILVCHLNRSQFDMVSGVTRKNFAAVRFPMVLDLGGVGVVTRVSGMEVDPGRPISGEVVGGEESGIGMGGGEGDDVGVASGEGLLYELKSVITHYGGHHNGHYICYRKARGRWWRVNDERVAEVGVEDVREVGNAFMIFYERVGEGEGGRGVVREEVEVEAGQGQTLDSRQQEGEGEGVVMKTGAVLGALKEIEIGRGLTGVGFGTESDVDAVLGEDGEELVRKLILTGGGGGGEDGELELELELGLEFEVEAGVNGKSTDGVPLELSKSHANANTNQNGGALASNQQSQSQSQLIPILQAQGNAVHTTTVTTTSSTIIPESASANAVKKRKKGKKKAGAGNGSAAGGGGGAATASTTATDEGSNLVLVN